jgi:BirA family biotin operon repressor/biotin-[acetyl-CoA-carboxylase] ligase
VRRSFDSGRVDAALITLPGAWRGLEFHASLPSTNEMIREYAAQPGPAADLLWRVVLTDHQTGGRGRLGRGWQVPDRAAIALSVVVPVDGTQTLPWVPLLAGVALVRAIEEVTASGQSEGGVPLAPRLKWPNDVLVPEDGDRKVSGILCELLPSAEGPLVVVVGTGVNVHQDRAELPVPTATSLALAGAQVGREDLVIAYLRELGRLFAPEATAERDAGRAAYARLCSTLGQQVRIHLPGDTSVDGVATRIDPSAALVVRTAAGERTFAAGDVVHVRPAETWLA